MLHEYKLNGFNIVLDTCSGSVHSVDEVAYDIIGMYQDHTKDEIVKAKEDDYAQQEREELLAMMEYYSFYLQYYLD